MAEAMYNLKELELNKKLLDACLKDDVDFGLVESLLQQGADPLGPVSLEGWDAEEHIYDEIILDACDNDAKNLPEFTRIFLKYGMDISKPRIPYDGRNNLNPMWSFAFITNENSAKALKMLLDSGIAYDMVMEFWDHAIFDLIYVDRIDPNNPENNDWLVWTMKMIMLCAAYPHILNKDEALKDFICYDLNSYDVRLFESWDNYEYAFDTILCASNPEFNKSIIRIFEKNSNKEVWKIGVGQYAKTYLNQLR